MTKNERSPDSERTTNVPMTIFSCKLKNSWFCTHEGVLPSGASNNFGSQFCNVPDSQVEAVATDCDSVVVKKTEIVAKVTKGGMIT